MWRSETRLRRLVVRHHRRHVRLRLCPRKRFKCELAAAAYLRRYFVGWQSNCCPVIPRVAGPNNARYGPVTDSGSGKVLMSSAG
jgi:hypothetical protein